MSDWKIIIPEATTNLVTNPSFETGTTGWTKGGTNTIAQSTDAKFFGSNSLKCTYADDDTLANYAVTLTAVAYIASAYVYIPSNYDGTQLQLQWLNFTSATVVNGSLDMTITDAWQRVTATITPDAGDLSGDLVLYENGTAPTATRFIYIDGVQIEAKTYATTYCDGTQVGCSWTGTVHASASTRLAREHSGGKIADFYDDYSFKVKAYPGTGVPPVVNQSTPYALQDGSLFKGLRYADRVFTLVGAFVGSSTSDLHAKRQALIKALSSRTGGISGAKTITIRYTGATVTKQIECVYDAGLELGMFANGIENDVPLRFVAFAPAWKAINDTGESLSVTSSALNYLPARISTKWQNIGTAPNSQVTQVLRADNGDIYITGIFTTVGGITANRVAKWDGVSWSTFGTGSAATVWDCAIDSQNRFYVVGSFTSIGGTAANYVACWDGSSWNALGTGLNALAYGITIDSNDNVYVGGDFTTAGGTTVNYVAKWNGSTWSALGTGANSSSVYRLAVDSNDNLYIVGDFTTVNNVSAAYFAKWNGSAWSTLGGVSPDAFGFGVGVDADDNVYVGGGFTTIGSTTVNYVAKWNGFAWSALGTGLGGVSSPNISSFAFGADGSVYIAGADITSAGGVTVSNVAVWKNNTWRHPGADFTANGSASNFTGIAVAPNNDLYVGLTASTYEGSTTIAYVGTEVAYPVITINRSGGTSATLVHLTNSTTGASILFNNYALLDGETLTLDLRPQSRVVSSSYFGTLWTSILDESDVASWYLQPDNTTGTSNNVITAYAYTSGSPTITTTLTYTATYRSLD